MFNDSPSTEKRLFTFGVPTLDEILGGGVAAGSNVLIEDEIGAEADPFVLQFLAEGLKTGEYGYIFSTEHPYEFYNEMMNGLGVNPEMLEATGRLKFIDAFSNPFGYTDLKTNHQYSVQDLAKPREINETIRRKKLLSQLERNVKVIEEAPKADKIDDKKKIWTPEEEKAKKEKETLWTPGSKEPKSEDKIDYLY